MAKKWADMTREEKNASNAARRARAARSTGKPAKPRPAKPAPSTTIHLSQDTQTPPPAAAQTLGNPGPTPAAALHETLMILFGPINYLLHTLGGFDLVEEEVNLILIPAERIIVRRGLTASGEIPPDLFDAIQIAVGVLQYGIRMAPNLAAKRAANGGQRPGGQPAGAPARPGAGGAYQNPGGGPTGGLDRGPWAPVSIESQFADVGIVAPASPGNGHLHPTPADPGSVGPTGSSGG